MSKTLKRLLLVDAFSPLENMPMTDIVTDPASNGKRTAVELFPIADLAGLRDIIGKYVDEATEVTAYTTNEMNFVLMREASGVARLEHANAGLFSTAPKAWRLDSASAAVLFDMGRRKVSEKGNVPVVVGMTYIYPYIPSPS